MKAREALGELKALLFDLGLAEEEFCDLLYALKVATEPCEEAEEAVRILLLALTNRPPAWVHEPAAPFLKRWSRVLRVDKQPLAADYVEGLAEALEHPAVKRIRKRKESP